MKKHRGLIEVVLVGVFVAIVVYVVACGTTNSNTNASASIATEKADLSLVEPRIVEICNTLSDKIVLHCSDSPELLSEWMGKAISDRESFISECVVDEVFKGNDEEKITTVEASVNDASNCTEIAETF